MAAILRGKTRDEWSALLEGSDACFAPVLTHRRGAAARACAVARRLRRGRRRGAAGPGAAFRPQQRRRRRTPAPAIGTHTDAVLAEAGFSADEIAALHAAGVAMRP